LAPKFDKKNVIIFVAYVGWIWNEYDGV